MAKTQGICAVAYDSPAKISKDAVVRFTKKSKTKFLKRFALSSMSTDIVYAAPSGDVIGYDKTYLPQGNVIGCLEADCSLSGTFYTTATGTDTQFVYEANVDATNINELDFYVYLPANGTYNFSSNLANYGTTNIGTADGNAYLWTVTANNGAGLYPVVLDLTQPAFMTGAGYTPSTQGFVLAITYNNSVAGQLLGISSLTVRESVDDLKCETKVVAKCLSGLEISPEVTYTESVCYGKKATDLTVSGSFTAKMLENKFFSIYNGVITEDGEFYTIKSINDVVITSTTVNGQTYGQIDLSDFTGDKCADTELILNICVDGQKGKRMNKLCIQDFSQSDLSTEDYIILSTENGDSRDGQIIVDSSLIGTSVCISYPVLEAGTQFSFTDEVTDDVVSALFLDLTNAGKKYTIEIPRMHITTMPLSLTSDNSEPEIQISFTTSKDDDNKFFKITYFND